ncbi:MAG: PAS domain S-box protein, partial [Candidatus Marinimicrobia bacterium]|nr:PAS domain S-box protein [Candidatus Neomarinimicrobiota bacterium]
LMNNPTATRIEHILSFSPAIIYTCRADGDFGATFISKNITHRFGYSVQECLDDPNFWRGNIHPDDSERIFENSGSLYKKGSHTHEYRFRKKDGSYAWVLDEVHLIRDSEGNPIEIVGSWLDITERKETEVALQKSEALFRAFFQTNPVATIITSTSGLVHMVNPAFTSRTDFTIDDVVGRTAQELGFWRYPEDRKRMVAAIQEHGYIDNLESSFYGKNNKPMTCIVSSRTIEYEGEVMMLSIVIDVTEQRKAEEDMRKLDQAKSDFISTAAHELRTPLIAIVGYSELLGSAGNTALTEEQKESYISIIQDQAEDLNHLVDNLLDVGRIQVGRSLGITPKEVELAGIVGKVVEASKMKSRRHNILVAHYNALPEKILIDGSRITQVLNNLLSNAIKYSPKGGPIKIQTMTDENKVTVSIIDQGIGMTPQEVEHVFDRFYRGEDEKAVACGLGLGMCIVEQIIADHGGEVFVSSTPGEGTTITFTLPIKQ